MCLNIINMYICGLGVGSERGGACPGTSQVTSRSVLLNASYHKEHEHIWFRGGDLDVF